MYFNIDRYTNHFTVTRYNPLSEKIIKDFCRQYIQYGLIKVGYKWAKVPMKVFAAHCPLEREYRFHKNQWKEFVRHCGLFGASMSNISVNDHTPDRGVFCDLLDESGKDPRDYQVPILKYLAYITNESRIKLVGIQTGKGKGQPTNSLIKVLGGWTTMGKVEPGHYVTGLNGQQNKVLAKYPQGVKDIYKVTFADDRSTICDDAHLWKVHYTDELNTKRWRIVNTLEMLRLVSLPDLKVYIGLCESEYSENDSQLPLDPYVLGTLVNEKIAPNLLKETGLYDIQCVSKYIPAIYLNASTSQRWSLLQGLMDSDGITDSDSIVYQTSSIWLAMDVQYLVRSLGGTAKIITKDIDTRKENSVYICVKTPESLFRHIDKREGVFNSQKASELRLQVTSVKHIGREETFCISVDSPDHLYITDDFIVTHNTYTAAKAICEEGRRFAVVLKAKYMDKWVSDILELTDCTEDEILVIRGSSALMAAIIDGTEGKLTAKAIVISNRTLQNYITLYEEKGDKILDLGYDCCPQDLFKALGVDTRLIDEVHEDFHFNFKLDLYTHIHRTISLSATLLSEDNFLTSMYELAYPLDERYDEMEYDRYIHSHSYHYEIYNADNIGVISTGTGMYSHHLLEQYILKNKKLRNDYFEMINELYEIYFESDFRSGERCLIYCASIDMCTALTLWLQQKYPKTDIRRYVENDPYENLMDARTSVSTLQSAGTGHDIKGLVFVLLTVAVSSSKSNIQGFGRLRYIEGRDLHFVYLVCANMQKHIQYHAQKKLLLQTRSLVHNDIISDKLLGVPHDKYRN